MSHYIQALVGNVATLQTLRSEHGLCRVFTHTPDAPWGVAPIVLDYDNVAAWYGPIGQASDDRVLPPCDIALGEALSRGSALAFVETNYLGGNGYQSAALWRDGALVFGLAMTTWPPVRPPAVAPPRVGLLGRLLGRQRPTATVTAEEPAPGPIDRALAGLSGAVPTGDEFVSFGFGSVRKNEDFELEWAEVTL